MLLNEKTAKANEKWLPLKKYKQYNDNTGKREGKIICYAIKNNNPIITIVLPCINSCFNCDLPFRKTPGPVM